MKVNWPSVTNLIDILAYLVKPYDTNGMELLYTISSSPPLKSKDSTTLVRSIERMTPEGKSDISQKLTLILTQYQSALHQAFGAGHEVVSRARKVKPLSIYILTDGIWQPHCDAQTPIRNIVQKLVQLNLDKKQVGIQFISFGNDRVGLQRLKELDDDMRSGNEPIAL